jgi:hypothetical protein
LVILIEWAIKHWRIKFSLINIKEVGQEVDPNSDDGTVYGDIRNCKNRIWDQRWQSRKVWMRSVKETKAHIGL